MNKLSNEDNANALDASGQPNQFGFDKPLHAWMSQFTGWLAPSSFLLAYFDWLTHLSHSPDKRLELLTNAIKRNIQFMSLFLQSSSGQQCGRCVDPKESDRRFKNELWNHFPFNMYSQFFLIYEQTWDDATKNIPGVSKHHLNLVNFLTRQMLDVFSPSNFPLTNPEVIKATADQLGINFVRGYRNLIEDISHRINKSPPVGAENFIVGKNVAITPGKVIYRNHLIELIQYEPTTEKVFSEPILIIPAWIMKYYILDLSPNNSMVKYLVDKGHTVFIISWRNPGSEDRNLSMDDYVKLGVMEAVNAINHIIPKQQINAVGYCIGGTLLMIAAAAMANANDHRLKSITLFATQVDFKDAGELLLFIDSSELNYIDDIMWEKGYLEGQQMAGTFSMLQSVDLIWSRSVLDYQLGQRRPMNDLMAWDSDTTRMPYKMHSEYLRKLFLDNDLVEGHYTIDGQTLALEDINIPIFAVSTIRDHVAPWKSVYKIHFLTDSDISFVLTSGGHNSGVVNEPGHPGRSYQLMKHKKDENYLSPESWQQQALSHEGSWWPAWVKWLAKHSGEKVVPVPMGNPQQGYEILCDAPGTYVLQK